uniref:ATP synthase F0 subunit 8 n=1 Tax=Arge similis TaxID=621222 RepID=A0A3S8V099_9HYME|nr:ATP synthase F0 subunit 8 [Arge similis]
MPQMFPMLWMNLYILFLILLFFFMIKFFYFFKPFKQVMFKNKLKMNMINMKW